MIRSMTAFASRQGGTGALSWTWEIRSVNARGLDIRMRLPEGIDGLEAAARSAIAARVTRGNVSVGLKISRDDMAAGLTLDEAVLDRVIATLAVVEDRAQAAGLALTHASAAEVLLQRGVLASGGPEGPTEAEIAALRADLDGLLDDFIAMREREGAAIGEVIAAQIERIADGTEAAARAAEARRDDQKVALEAALRRVVEAVGEVDEGRVAQELALIAVKQDVTEEIDRLHTHVAAARELLTDEAAQGRRLDFLAQEFNREANTLCSKSQNAALTAIGLDLKAAIDQMREQIQNVE